jgi:Tol biopolymer transport system component
LVDPETGTNLVQLTSGEFDHHNPAWSPDGQFLVFSTNRASAQEAQQSAGRGLNLYVVNRDGTGLTQLTAGDVQATSPDWGTDGWIYFASNQAGNFDIWRLQPTGKYAGLSSPPLGAPPSPEHPAAAPAPRPAATHAPTPGAPGCAKDTDCKGDRVCEHGLCIAP